MEQKHEEEAEGWSGSMKWKQKDEAEAEGWSGGMKRKWKDDAEAWRGSRMMKQKHMLWQTMFLICLLNTQQGRKVHYMYPEAWCNFLKRFNRRVHSSPRNICLAAASYYQGWLKKCINIYVYSTTWIAVGLEYQEFSLHNIGCRCARGIGFRLSHFLLKSTLLSSKNIPLYSKIASMHC